jgi:hypothetical protein
MAKKRNFSQAERRATWLRGLHHDGLVERRLFVSRCDGCEGEIVGTVGADESMSALCNRCGATTTRRVSDVIDCRHRGGGTVKLGRRTIDVCGCKPAHMI